MRETRNKLLVTTAALVAGITIAAAQGMPGGGAGGAGGRQEHQQLQSTQNRGGGQAQERSQQGREQGQAQRSEGQRNQTTGQASQGQREQGNRQGKAEQRNQAQSKQGQAEQRNQAQRGQAEQRNQAQSKQGQTDHTTGQAPREQGQAQQNQLRQGQTQQNRARQDSSGRVNLTNEQRTRIQRDVLSQRDVPRADRVDFALNVGTRVPSRVHVVEVPETLIEIHPEWRGDRYFVANDEIVIVDNESQIVSTVPVGSSSGSLNTGRGAQLSNNEGGINLGSDQIRQVQMVLREKGFLRSEPDGVFGPRTRQALVTFQQRQGLEATGRIDQKTFASLGISEKGGQAGEQSGTTGRGGEQGQGGNMQQPPAKQPSGNQSSTDQGMRNGKGGQQSTTGQGGKNQPSTSGQGGKMQPPANQDVGKAQPNQKIDQGNSKMNQK
jgi:peptidoglycan hydrolase-like protein with peptidoglycan-binding domain